MTVSGREASSTPFQIGLRSILLTILLFGLLLSVLRIALDTVERQRVSRAMGRIAFDLSQLQAALEAYKLDQGTCPPPATVEAIRAHALRLASQPIDFDAIIQQSQLDLTKLDEKESLVLWLGGDGHREFRIHPEEYFVFHTKRLVDSDNDGWLEYSDGRGNVYRFVDGKVVVRSPVTGQMTSIECDNGW